MHFVNKLLPAEEKEHLENNEAQSLREITATAQRLLAHTDENIDAKRIVSFLRLLRIHKALKYYLPVSKTILLSACH
jgi:hypothetical protein